MSHKPRTDSIYHFFGSCVSCVYQGECSAQFPAHFMEHGACPSSLLDTFHGKNRWQTRRTLFAIRGKLHSGKSTVAGILDRQLRERDTFCKPMVFPLAAPLYGSQEQFNMLQECGTCHKLAVKGVAVCPYCGGEASGFLEKHRRFLQEMGELARAMFGDRVLAFRLWEAIAAAETATSYTVIPICDDPRTKVDFDMLKLLNAVVIAIQTPDEERQRRGEKNGTTSAEAERHRLETELDNYGSSDFVITDRGGLDDTTEQVKTILDRLGF